METNKKMMYEVPLLEELYIVPAVVKGGFSNGPNENLEDGESTEIKGDGDI